MADCRICRGDESDGELFHPCKCTGSIRNVHQDCLKAWLVQGDKRKCELCGWTYLFTPVYGPNVDGPQFFSYLWYGWTLSKEYIHRIVVLARAAFIISLTALVLGYSYRVATRYGDLLAQSFLRKCGIALTLHPVRVKQFFDPKADYGAFGNQLASGLVLLAITMVFVLAIWLVSCWTLHDRILLLENTHILEHGREWTGTTQLKDTIEAADRLGLRAAVEHELGAEQAQDFVDHILDNEDDMDFDEQEGWFWQFMYGLFDLPLVEQIQNTCLAWSVFIVLMAFVYVAPYTFGVLDYSLLAARLGLPSPNCLELRIVCYAIGAQHVAFCAMAPYLLFFKYLAPYKFGRKVLSVSKQLASIEKVYLVVFMEAVIFPIFCGVLVHISMLSMIENPSFIPKFNDYPRSHFALWWGIGMFYMYVLSDFFRNCRAFFRPGVLYFIQDTSDPRNDPIRHFLSNSLLTHARKILFSALVYLGLLLGCIGGVATAISVTGLVRPLCLDWPEHDVLRLWPFMALFGYLVIYKGAISHMSTFSKVVFEREFRRAADWLNLGSFLFCEIPKPGAGAFVRAPSEDSPLLRRNARLFAIATPQDELVDKPQKGKVELKDYVLVWRPQYFWPRVIALLAWIVTVSTTMCLAIVLVPLLLAREYSAALLPSVRTDYSLYIVGFCWCAAAVLNSRYVTSSKEAARLVLSAIKRGNIIYFLAPFDPATPLLSSIIYGWCTFVPYPPDLSGFGVVDYASMCSILLPQKLALGLLAAIASYELFQPSDWKKVAVKEYHKIEDRLVNV